MNTKEMIISNVLEKMEKHLSKEQITILEQTLSIALHNCKISTEKCEVVQYDNFAERILCKFLTAKRIAGCSDETIKSYSFHLKKLILNLWKPLTDLETDDIRYYLANYKEQQKVSNVTLDNIRRSISSFFGWMHDEGLIQKNPMRRIARIKSEKVIKKPFSEEDLEKLRMNCKRERDLAIIEFLYSSGVRISEIVRLNRDQINFSQKDCIVFGKGAKERVVYLNSKACIHLKMYLESRTDNNPALFVSVRKPYNRLSKEAIETIIRNIGKVANVPKTHPHRFRRTMATNAINRGMPIQEVKEILGHEKIDTTMIYCVVSQDNIRLSHRRYVA